MIEVLEPAMIATEALSKDDINLVEGEIIIKSLVQETAKLKSPLARDFHKSLTEKLALRRSSVITSLVLYLMNSDSLSRKEIEKYPLKLESKKVVQQAGTVIMKRLYEEEALDDDDNGSSQEDDQPMSFKEVLKKNIEMQKVNASKPANVMEELNTISKDFKIYDSHKKRSPLMEKLVLSLSSIQPTSVQSERNFSLASSFVTKIRSSLSHQHIDMLCFLKSKFMSEKKQPK